MQNQWIKRILLAAGLLGIAIWGTAKDAGAPMNNSAPAMESELNSSEGADSEDSDGDQSDAESDEDSESEEGLAENAAERVTKEISTAIKENSADELLNLATEAKLSAESILDLTKVIAYCVEAEKKGLSEESREFCRQLKTSSQLERGLALSKMFLAADFDLRNLPRGWQLVRSMAQEDLEAAVEANSDLTLAQLALGRLQMLPEGDVEKARGYLDTAIKLAAEEAPEVLPQALEYRAMLEDDNEKATEMLTRALEADEENAPILHLLSLRMLEVRQNEKALELIDKALAADPENESYKKAKANVLAALERYDEAEKLFNEATEEGKDNLLTQIERAQFLALIGKTEEGIKVLDGLIEKMDAVPSLYYFRSLLYSNQKEYRKALRDINKAIGLDSTFTEAILLKVSIYLQQEKYEEAVRLLNRLQKRDPEDEQLTSQLAYALAHHNEFGKAMETLNTLLEKKPDSLVLLRMKGDLYLLYGQWNETIAVYEDFLAKSPKDSGVLNNYAWLLATSPEDSVRNASKALELATKAAELTNYGESYILSTLAASYAESGDFEKAQSWSEKAVALAEKEKHDRLEDLKKELESYKKKEAWREVPEKQDVPLTAPTEEASNQEESVSSETETKQAPPQEASASDSAAENSGTEEFF